MISGSFWDHFHHSQRSTKISTNTHRTKLNLCELNTTGDTLKFENEFEAWQILFLKFCSNKNLFEVLLEN